MRFAVATLLFGVSSISLGACSPLEQITTISTAQTCSQVEEILADVATVLIQLAVNPLALPVYEERLRALSLDLRDLRPVDSELNASVDEVAEGMNQILDAADLSTPTNLAGLPSGVAKVQGSLEEVLDKCERLVAA
jgi:DNA repair ATPase RecN